MGLDEAAHAEISPEAPRPLISRMSPSPSGSSLRVKIRSGTLLHQIYGLDEAMEQFRCSFGLNPDYKGLMKSGRLRVSAEGPRGEVAGAEWSGRRFFVGSLFVPQMASSPERPHPLIAAFIRAAAGFSDRD